MDDYDIIKHLGSGSYGEAYLAKKKEDGSKCVLKEIKIGHLNNNELKDTNQEVKVLASLVHSNITRFHHSFYKVASLFIVMEYCAAGDLKTLIYNRKGTHFPEERILDWFCQLCLAIKYIHDRHIIHRDIKPQNVLLTEDGKVKLGDFGVAKILNKTSDLANTCIGTPYYLSPEMCENRPYSMKSDIWALGCVLYELTALQHAFNAKNMKILVTKIVKCTYQAVPNKYSRDMKLLIASIFQRDFKQRPSINIILRKSFIMKRISRFVSEEDCEQLKASILSNKGKKLKTNITMRSAIGKRIGISGPLAKYGNSSKGPVPKSVYGNRNHQSISTVRTPRSSNGIKTPKHGNGCLQKSVKNVAKRQTMDANSQESFPSDDLFPVHYAKKESTNGFLKRGRNSSSKITLNKMMTAKSLSEKKISKVRLNTSKCDNSFMKCGRSKLEISQSLLNSLHDSSLYDNKGGATDPHLEKFVRPKTHSTPIVISCRKSISRQALRSSLLRRKISALASNEVKKVSIAAQQLRHNRGAEPSTGYNPENLAYNGVCGILSPEDINISVPSVCRTTTQRDSFEDILRMNDFIEPVLECNDDSRRSPSFCRAKWNPAATPIFSTYPLELTDTRLDSTISPRIPGLAKRKQWSQSNDDILNILSSASLSDGQIETSGRLSNPNSGNASNCDVEPTRRLSKSRSLPNTMHSRVDQKIDNTDIWNNANLDEQYCNKTIQGHELISEKNERSLGYQPSPSFSGERSFNNDIRIRENFVDNSPNFHESTTQKTVSFNQEVTPDKRKLKRRLFSFLYKNAPPKNIPEGDKENGEKFFKKSRISGLLKRFIKRGDKNSSNCDQTNADCDLSLSHCLHEGDLYATEVNTVCEAIHPVNQSLVGIVESSNTSNIDSGVELNSKQTTLSEFDATSPTGNSRYCVSLNSGVNEVNYNLTRSDLSSINNKEDLRKTAFVFVEGVFQSAIKNLRKKQHLGNSKTPQEPVSNSPSVKQSSLTETSLQEKSDNLNHTYVTKFNQEQELKPADNIYHTDNDGFIKDVARDNFYDKNTFKFVDRVKPDNVPLSYEDLSVNDLYCHELTAFNCDSDPQRIDLRNTYVIDDNLQTSSMSLRRPNCVSMHNESEVDSTTPLSAQDSKHFWKSLEDLLSIHEDNHRNLATQVNVAELGLSQGMEDVFGWIEEKKAVLEEQLGLDEFLENYKIMEKAFEAETEILGDAVLEVRTNLGPKLEHFTNQILELLIAESIYQS